MITQEKVRGGSSYHSISADLQLTHVNRVRVVSATVGSLKVKTPAITDGLIRGGPYWVVMNKGANSFVIATVAGVTLATVAVDTAAFIYLGVGAWVVVTQAINTARTAGFDSGRAAVSNLITADATYDPECVAAAELPPSDPFVADPSPTPAELAISGYAIGFFGSPSFWNGSSCYTVGSYTTGGPMDWEGVFDNKISETEWRPTGDTGHVNPNFHTKRSYRIDSTNRYAINTTNTKIILMTYDGLWQWVAVLAFTSLDNTQSGTWHHLKPLGNIPEGSYTLDPDNTNVQHGACYTLSPKTISIIEN